MLDRNVLPVIEYANETNDTQAFNMMTMALLCRLPEDIEDLSVLAYHLHATKHSNILHDSLGSFPR